MSATMTPLRGDPDALQTYVARHRETAQAILSASRKLKNLSSEQVHISKAVDRLDIVARDAAVDTDGLAVRYSGAAGAIERYSVRLRSAQDRARVAIDSYNRAESDLWEWRRRKQDYEERASQPGEDQAQWSAHAVTAAEELRACETRRARAISEYEAAVSDRDEAARTAIGDLRSSRAIARLDDSTTDKVKKALRDAYEWLQENVAPVLEVIKELAKKLAELVGFLALIVSILSIVLPFLGPIALTLATIDKILGIVALIATLLLVVLGKSTLREVITEALNFAAKGALKKLGGVISHKLGRSLSRAALSKFTMATKSFKLGERSIGQMVSKGIHLGVKESVKLVRKGVGSFVKDQYVKPLATDLADRIGRGPVKFTFSWNLAPVTLTTGFPLGAPVSIPTTPPMEMARSIGEALTSRFAVPGSPSIPVHYSGGGGGGGGVGAR